MVVVRTRADSLPLLSAYAFVDSPKFACTVATRPKSAVPLVWAVSSRFGQQSSGDVGGSGRKPVVVAVRGHKDWEQRLSGESSGKQRQQVVRSGEERWRWRRGNSYETPLHYSKRWEWGVGSSVGVDGKRRRPTLSLSLVFSSSACCQTSQKERAF